MSDARALLRAKRQEIRISHPFASYTTSGQLRCTACTAAVKNASAWEGHIGSKVHRMSVLRRKEEERIRAEQLAREEEEMRAGKRKAGNEDGSDGMDYTLADESEAANHQAKRRRTEESSSPQPVSARSVDENFPADFFSDKTRLIPTLDSDSDADAAGGHAPAVTLTDSASSTFDAEWEKFQKTVLAEVKKNPMEESERRDMFERATVFAEPELASTIPQGFPVEGNPPATTKEKEADPEEELRQKELDERELIMDRLMEEEQAQKEADNRVLMLKVRLDALKRKREAANFKVKK